MNLNDKFRVEQPASARGRKQAVAGKMQALRRSYEYRVEKNVLLSQDLIGLLGHTYDDIVASDFINKYSFNDFFEDPPFRFYVGSPTQGVDLLFEKNSLIDIQVFVQDSKSHKAFSSELPFGIKTGMNQNQVQAILGEASYRKDIGLVYDLPDDIGRLTVIFDKSGLISYISIQGMR